MLGGVYRRGSDGKAVFVEVAAPADEALQTALHQIIARVLKLLTQRGVLVEEQKRADCSNTRGRIRGTGLARIRVQQIAIRAHLVERMLGQISAARRARVTLALRALGLRCMR